MVQTYQGYFQEDGRFVSENLFIKIPANRLAIVNILDNEVMEVKPKFQKQAMAFERFVAKNKGITDEPFTEEFDAIIASGVGVGGALDL